MVSFFTKLNSWLKILCRLRKPRIAAQKCKKMKYASLNFHDSAATALIDDHHKTPLDIINCQKSGFLCVGKERKVDAYTIRDKSLSYTPTSLFTANTASIAIRKRFQVISSLCYLNCALLRFALVNYVRVLPEPLTSKFRSTLMSFCFPLSTCCCVLARNKFHLHMHIG